MCVVKPTEISSELVERQKRQISPGPPGLDEGGSPPPSLDQNQQQKSPSIIQIPQAIKQPFSSPSSNVLMANQRQQNISSPQLSLDEAKESQEFDFKIIKKQEIFYSCRNLSVLQAYRNL